MLSRVHSLDELFLFEEIGLEKSFAPSEELKVYFQRAKRQETAFLKEQKIHVAVLFKRLRISHIIFILAVESLNGEIVSTWLILWIYQNIFYMNTLIDANLIMGLTSHQLFETPSASWCTA